MPSFPRPSFTFDYNADAERAVLRRWRDTQPGRAIPAKDMNRLLLATWNIANLGAQDRGPKDYALLAEVISWFDLVAVQEVKNNRNGLNGLMAALPASWRTLYSDAAGNDERMTFVYDSEKVKPRELTGEVAVAPSDLKNVTLPETTVAKFVGFDRNPYIASFQAGTMVFCLVNVHLYYGDDTATEAMERRALEAFAVAQWCKRESKSHYALTPIIAALGDFNLPKIDPTDPIFKALTRTGLQLPEHSTQIGSNLAGDEHYDQVAFFPTELARNSPANQASSISMAVCLLNCGQQRPPFNSEASSNTISAITDHCGRSSVCNCSRRIAGDVRASHREAATPKITA